MSNVLEFPSLQQAPTLPFAGRGPFAYALYAMRDDGIDDLDLFLVDPDAKPEKGMRVVLQSAGGPPFVARWTDQLEQKYGGERPERWRMLGRVVATP